MVWLTFILVNSLIVPKIKMWTSQWWAVGIGLRTFQVLLSTKAFHCAVYFLYMLHNVSKLILEYS